MNTQQARARVAETFPQQFNRTKFLEFSRNLLNKFDESKAQAWNATYVKDAFKPHVSRFERLGTYTSPDDEKLDVLVVHLTNDSKLERARTAIRNFVADHLKTRNEKDAALVAFVSPTERQWRFSYVKMEYAAVETESGKVGVETRLTPARRYSYIVGEGESCHTAQTRFLALLQDTENYPTLAQLEEAFSVEAVTKEFFIQYASLFGDIDAALQKLAAKDAVIGKEFKAKNVSTVDFAKKLMGQIVFLYFLQKKGWLGVEKGQDWGTGPHDFLRRLARGDYGAYENFFNDILEPLFYDTLATDRGHEAMCRIFKCRIPFLNGGLFEPLGHPELIQKRTHRAVPIPPGGVLSDYIPFYFTPHSPMLLNIKTGHNGITQRPMSEIVILVSSLPALVAQEIPFVFTDRHAYLQTAAFYSDLARLDCLAWDLLQNRDFKRDLYDPGKFERYQAEALVHHHLPVTALSGIICHGDAQKVILQGEIANRRQTLQVTVKSSCYF